MAWTVVNKTAQIKTMVEDPGAVRTSDIDTTGYDKIIFFNSNSAANAGVEVKLSDNADSTQNGYYPLVEDAGTHKAADGNVSCGYCNVLPETMTLVGADDLGNVWVELRRTVTHDRGRG